MIDGWRADFDFIMRIDKATAILEGKYGTPIQAKTKNNSSDIFKELKEELCE